MKKMKLLKSILLVLGFYILSSFTLAIGYILVPNWPVAYIIGYGAMIGIFYFIYKEDLKNNYKTLKEDIKKSWKKILPFTILFTILVYISNFLLYHFLGDIAQNEALVREELFASPILMSISIVILGPIVEELIFRMPFKNIQKHKFLTFIIYSLIFAGVHIVVSSSLLDLLFIIPYMFLSLSFGYSFYKTDNIYLSMIIHILNNFLNVMILLFL